MAGFTGRWLGQMLIAAVTSKQFKRTIRDSITAFATGGKASATKLQYGYNRISVCATGGDSVLLPAAVPGAEVWLVHDGAAAAQVFGQGTDTIDAVATGTGVAMTQAKRGVFVCHTAGAWQSCVGAKST